MLLHWPVIILKQIKRLILSYRFGKWDTVISLVLFYVCVQCGFLMTEDRSVALWEIRKPVGNLSDCEHRQWNVGTSLGCHPKLESWKTCRIKWHCLGGSGLLDLCISSSLGTSLLRSWDSFTAVFPKV